MAACSSSSAPGPALEGRDDAVVDGTLAHEFTIGATDASSAYSNAAVGYAAGGNHLVVWEQRACSGGTCDGGPTLRAVHVGPSGVVNGTPFALGSGASQTAPAVTFDGTNFLVVWVEGAQVLAQRVSASSSAAPVVDSAPVSVYAYTSAVRGAPAVASAFSAAAPPEYFVAVQDGADLRGVRLNLNAKGALTRSNGLATIAATTATGCSVVGTCEARAPSLASDGAAYVIAWGVHGTSVSATGVYAASVTNKQAGVQVGTVRRLDASSGSATAAAPRLAWAGGRYLVAWNESASTTTAIRLNADATLADAAPFPVSPAGLGGDCAVTASGSSFVVVYRRAAGASSALYGARVGATGAVADASGFWIEAGRSLDAVSADASGNFAVLSTVALDAARTGIVGRVGPAAGYPVTISGTGRGAGTVTSLPAVDDAFCPTCQGSYDHSFAMGTALELVGRSATDRFSGFAGDCTGLTCDLVVDGPKVVGARFDALYQLTVARGGTAGGTVVSDPAGIACGTGGACEASYVDGGTVTLTATPASGASVAWSFPQGGCTATGDVATCTLSAPLTAQAEFVATAPSTALLTVSKIGDGSGSVSSDVAGIDCGTACSAAYPLGSTVTLTASPGEALSTFAGWGGPCAGTGACVVTVNEATSVMAQFDSLPPPSATVTVSTSGAGTVTSEPAGILCGVVCSAELAATDPATLSAIPASGWEFVGWSGDCTGTAACDLALDGDRSVTATFREIPPTLYRVETSIAGTGGGTITPTPAGSSCGTGCVEYVAGTPVTFAAIPDGSSSFAGWGGACTGTGGCSVRVDGDVVVTAQFDRLPPPTATITIRKTGTGSGVVSSSGAVSCGTTCGASFEVGTTVTFTASAIGDSRFAGWGAPCAGTGTCVVTVSGPLTIDAQFDAPATYRLTTTANGTGAGRITGAPGPIDCSWSAATGHGGVCGADQARGSSVVLTAEQAEGSSFAGWSGGPCSGTSPTCTVTMDLAKTVAATFMASTPVETSNVVLVRIFGSLHGGVVGGPIACTTATAQCSGSVPSGGTLTLTALESDVVRFAGWTGCTPQSGDPLTCTVKPAQSTVVIASFESIQPPAPTANPVTVRVFGRGRVSGGGVDCSNGSGTCGVSVAAGTTLSLQATPAAGYTFRQWQGCAPILGTPTSCTLTPTAGTAVVAVFDPPPPAAPASTYPVFVRLFGTAGSVSGGGLDCRRLSGTCRVDAAPGTSLLLTARPGTTAFERWQGCTPTADSSSCTLRVTGATAVAAFFEWPAEPPPPETYAVIVRTFGVVGSVSGSGLACTGNAGTCRVDVPNTSPATQVTLRATPPAGTVLGSWGGCLPDPRDRLSCTATADANKVVTATFVAGQ
ncbi:hypothetical protein [Anaeromyxobacter sp. Fw109-5]|uniref:InlB B-repeat-containing protein n=1 Tax=Anaeromyxobacter sp. (strain Fw109-5) TaxID=404589 RepID=UPI0013053A44|nr:hypothetical protein [Anaeromyxobacter sp. Fw109-5]